MTEKIHRLLVAIDQRMEEMTREIQMLPEKICQQLEKRQIHSNNQKIPQEIKNAINEASLGLKGLNGFHFNSVDLEETWSEKNKLTCMETTYAKNSIVDQTDITAKVEKSPIRHDDVEIKTPDTMILDAFAHHDVQPNMLDVLKIDSDTQPSQTKVENREGLHHKVLFDSNESTTSSMKGRKRRRVKSNSTCAINTTIYPTTHIYLWRDGIQRQVPEGWRCQPSTCKVFWTRWFQGDRINRIPPYQQLESSDLVHSKTIEHFNRGRYIVKLLIEIAISNGYVDSEATLSKLSPSKNLQVFDIAFNVALGRTKDGRLSRPGFEQLAADHAKFYMFESIYELLQQPT